MSERHIQYARTTDGVDIAYTMLGEGRPLFFIVGPGLGGSNIDAGPYVEDHLAQQEALSKARTLVSLDLRGHGVSGTDVNDYSLEGYVRDVQAVADRLGAATLDIFALGTAAPIAVAFAAGNPGRVNRQILWQPIVKFRTPPLESLSPALRLLLESDWKTFTEVSVRTYLGWEEGRGGERAARLMRESLTPERYKTMLEALGQFDVTDQLPNVACPTLVLQRRGVPGRRRSSAVAAAIPDARMVTVEGDSPTTFRGLDAWLGIVDEFLGESGGPASGAESAPAESGALQTILFTDVEGSTALTDRLGDAAARELMREHERITREALKAHGGSEVKTMGDGFMASFGSATKALECAVAIQRNMEHGTGNMGNGIRVRCGLNAGEPIAEDDDLFGTAVIVAARIAAQAKGGEILVSDVVRQLVAGKGFLFNDRGEHALKGFENPVRVWEVRLQRGEK